MCSQYVAVITNNATLALEEGERPEVFFSGAVHGNERVGPTSTVEFAKLLVHNYLYAPRTPQIEHLSGS